MAFPAPFVMNKKKNISQIGAASSAWILEGRECAAESLHTYDPYVI